MNSRAFRTCARFELNAKRKRSGPFRGNLDRGRYNDCTHTHQKEPQYEQDFVNAARRPQDSCCIQEECGNGRLTTRVGKERRAQ